MKTVDPLPLGTKTENRLTSSIRDFYVLIMFTPSRQPPTSIKFAKGVNRSSMTTEITHSLSTGRQGHDRSVTQIYRLE